MNALLGMDRNRKEVSKWVHIKDCYKGSAYLYDTPSILLGVFNLDNQISFIEFLYLFLSLFSPSLSQSHYVYGVVVYYQKILDGLLNMAKVHLRFTKCIMYFEHKVFLN